MFNASRFMRIAAPASAASIISASYINKSTLTLAEAKATTTTTTTTIPAVKIEKIKAAIANLIEDDATKREDGTALTGTFVRLAWHCAGTYSKADGGSGGSNGARMRHSPEAKFGANAGLKMARDALEPVKVKFPDISYADLYTLAGVVAIEESGGPTIPFRFGRTDMPDGETSPPDGRLPDADKGSSKPTIAHIRDVFYRMGFSDREIVALLGAHALGRCHTDASGYWGPWTNAETTMSNEYFRLLIEERWSPKVSHNGKPWEGPAQFEDPSGNLMMLPSDIALIEDPEFKKYVEMYAKNEDLFFTDFAKAFSKLLELGVPFPKPWYRRLV